MRMTIGSTSPRETHDSREIERLRSGRLVTVRKNGDYAALRAAQPAPGDSSDGGKVQTSRLRRLHGGMGLLEYTVRTGDDGGGAQYAGAETDAVVEIEMAQTERPIMAREDFSGYQDQIERWRTAPQELREGYKYYDDNGDEQDLEGKGLEAAKLIRKGIEAYLVFHPVVTVTKTYSGRPSDYGRDIGKRCRPSESGYPGGYDYLKTADRLSRSQDGETWTRVEQWTGAKEADGGWEKSLYEEA